MIARCFEEAGLITTGIVLIKEHAQRTKPPRMLSVPFKFGNALGIAGNADYQHKILTSVFDLLNVKKGPVLQEFIATNESKPLTTSLDNSDLSVLYKNANCEIKSFANNYILWLKLNNNRTAVGLSGVDHKFFPDLIKYLEKYISGDTLDSHLNYSNVNRLQFIRYCVDDLKAYCYESKLAEIPNIHNDHLNEWFWDKTATGDLISKLSIKMQADDDDSNRIAYGIAR